MTQAEMDAPGPPPMQGLQVIERALATLPLSPGVYRMLDAKGDALYVGKARALKRRVAAYTQLSRLPERLRRMVHETRQFEVITTGSEAEALLLEANLIKRLRPRYNIVLRDDKSYPWLVLTEDHPYPQITKHRGERRKGASYWGPFASTWAVNQTLTALQRVFLLRSCRDTVFDSRDRPCLLYQIRRCSGPCVERIARRTTPTWCGRRSSSCPARRPPSRRTSPARWRRRPSGWSSSAPAALRDRIRGLTHVQGRDRINMEGIGDADVVALHQLAGRPACRCSSSAAAATTATGRSS
jgi:excinuclease ABC subunit C